MLKLNLGCGQNKLEGYTNLDKYDTYAPDVVCDLEVFPWPFQTNSVDNIVMNHVLEHLGATTDAFFSIMKELYRICAPGSKILIAVPHPRSEGFEGDPTHVRPITPNILSLFSKRNNCEWKEKGWPNSPLANYLDVDFEFEPSDVKLEFTPHWQKRALSGTLTQDELDFALNSYFNVVNSMTITLTVIK